MKLTDLLFVHWIDRYSAITQKSLTGYKVYHHFLNLVFLLCFLNLFCMLVSTGKSSMQYITASAALCFKGEQSKC